MKLAASFLTILLFSSNQALEVALNSSISGVAHQSVQSGPADPQGCGDPRLLTPFMRHWNPTPGVTNHFYTHSQAEKEWQMNRNGYLDEGFTGWIWPNAGQPQTVPFYHLWNQNIKNSFYTASLSERNTHLTQYGYIDVGIAGYVSTNEACGGKPFWRMWSQSNLDSFYTMSAAEKDEFEANGYVTIDVVAYLLRYW